MDAKHTDNLFEVRMGGDDHVLFSIPGMHGDRRYRLDGILPRDHALNLAAWILLQVDPTGKQFTSLVEEIKKV